MKTLLVATRNSGKLKEIFASLNNRAFTLLSPQDARVPEDFDIAETGSTLSENVILKAKGFSQKTGLFTLADDTGLFVKALNGRPGVRSRRFAPTPDERNKKLIKELKEHHDKSAYSSLEETTELDSVGEFQAEQASRHKHDKYQRNHSWEAYFKAVIALYHPQTKLLKTFIGISRGKIIDQPQGKHGFGYDPIFFSADLHKTFAQATLKEKLTVSARGRALAKARLWLKNWTRD